MGVEGKSIFQNVVLGVAGATEMVEEACRAVLFHEFARDLPAEYDMLG